MTTTACLREADLKRSYGAADDRLREFYVPALSAAHTYDRLVGYWRSSSLVVAATGLARFVTNAVENGGRMRIIAGAELTEDDVEAIVNGEPLDEVAAARMLSAPDKFEDVVSHERRRLLAWMVREGLLEIKVGVPLDANGQPLSPAEAERLFHTKFGVLTDQCGHRVAFQGSINESYKGWEGNYEAFNVFHSWDEHVWDLYGQRWADEFQSHWDHGGESKEWAVIDLPEAVRQHLISTVEDDWIPPLEDPAEHLTPAPVDEAAQTELEELAAAPMAAGGTGVGFVTVPVEPWPHQRSIASRILGTWPRSYLLADEVGLGKTIEAGLVIKELILSGKADRILLLVPASVQQQWQEELWEKLCLNVPSYREAGFVDVHGDEVEPPAGANPWSAFPVVLASSHLARRRQRRDELLAAAPWDLVLVDEAHHARRRGIGGKDAANQLLQLLRVMRDEKAWKALLLATATPMQMNTVELFDLLDLLGLPPRWATSPEDFEGYYRQLAEEDLKARDWDVVREMLRAHLDQPDVRPNRVVSDRLTTELAAPARQRISKFHDLPMSGAEIASWPSTERRLLDAWLRANTPLKDRVFRTSRAALREYQRQGIIPYDKTIPHRIVEDRFISLDDDKERKLYDRIESYITRYYEAYNRDTKTKPLGFIMTVYRRRLTSSLYAVRESLRRRLEGLEQKAALAALLDEDDAASLENLPDWDGELEGDTAVMLEQEIHELKRFVGDLETAVPNDTKVQRLVKHIKEAFLDGHQTVAVFTQFTDTLHWLRDQLKDTYKSQIACYSGEGGSRWSNETQRWEPLSKEQVKKLFRAGEEVKILLGTDAMSEGLNLQTSDRLFNYDMPWNFTRVEQRIGRLDRIGGRKVVKVTNYFYEGTVEEQIYSGIREDADWFQDVVGPAQPVLNRVEEVIQSVAMQAPGAARDQALEHELAEVRQSIADAQRRALKIEDLDDESLPPETYGADPMIDLEEIEQILTTNPLTAPKLHPHPDFERSYLVEVAGEKVAMTFDRQLFDRNSHDIEFMTYGHPVFQRLLEEVQPRATRGAF